VQILEAARSSGTEQRIVRRAYLILREPKPEAPAEEGHGTSLQSFYDGGGHWRTTGVGERSLRSGDPSFCRDGFLHSCAGTAEVKSGGARTWGRWSFRTGGICQDCVKSSAGCYTRQERQLSEKLVAETSTPLSSNFRIRLCSPDSVAEEVLTAEPAADGRRQP